MKLINLFEHEELDPNSLTDDEQLMWLKNEGEYNDVWGWARNMSDIKNPSINVQLAALEYGIQILSINNPADITLKRAIDLDNVGNVMYTLVSSNYKLSNSVVKYGLSNVTQLKNKHIYDMIVKRLFPTSSLSVNKWIKFGDRARSQIAKGKWK